MKRIAIFVFFSLALAILPAMPAGGQTTHNLDIIWQKASPDIGGGIRYWGFNMAGGDLNGDGYSDFLSATDTSLGIGTDRIKCRIYVFSGGVTISTTPSQIITYDSLCKSPTFCIADFNKDGYGDLAVGDMGGVGVNSEKGQVNIHYGTGIDLPNTPDLIIGGYNGIAGTGFGSSLSSGDINGDGIDDLVVGAPGYIISSDRKGRVYVYYGDTLGLHIWPDIILNGHSSPINYERFGQTVVAGCDINKDGYNDIISCGYLNSEREVAGGKVYYYLSQGVPIDTIADGWIYGEGYEQTLGERNVSIVPTDTASLLSVGWFGTPIWNNPSGGLGEGKCYMVPGDTTGELTPLWTITGEDTGLGVWSSSAGYADGDKLGDFLAGASPSFDHTGRAYLWLRRPTMRNQYDAYIQGRYPQPTVGVPGDVLGARVEPAGDVDGDGKDEFLISNYYADNNTLGDSSNMIWLCKYTGPDGVAGRPADSGQRQAFWLGQNYPNPFRQSTVIRYQVTGEGPVNLSVYNITGQRVKILVNEPFGPRYNWT